MKEKFAKQRYKKYWKKMAKHLDGITVSKTKNGEIDIPDSDLKRAYDMVTKGHSNIEWD